jgi:hypothetical protein
MDEPIRRQPVWAAVLWASLLAIFLGGAGLVAGWFLAMQLTSLPSSLSFADRLLGFGLPLFLCGLFIGRFLPRWGWLPALLTTWGSLGLMGIFAPAAALLGWLLGLLAGWRSSSWGKFALFGILGVLILFCGAQLKTLPDRQWLADRTLSVAHHFGADPQNYRLSLRAEDIILPFPMLIPGRIYEVEARLNYADKQGRSEEIKLLLDDDEFRRRSMNRSFGERNICTNPPAAFPQNLAEARALALKFRVPKEFLADLHPAGIKQSYGLSIEDSSGELSPGSAPVFVAGPPKESGTWHKPSVVICGGQVTVGFGESPH